MQNIVVLDVLSQIRYGIKDIIDCTDEYVLEEVECRYVDVVFPAKFPDRKRQTVKKVDGTST